jgi:hypothetical protein
MIPSTEANERDYASNASTSDISGNAAEPSAMTKRRALYRQLGWYVAITFGSSYAIAWLTWSRGGLGHFPGLPLAMLSPMLAALFVQRVIAREPVFRRGRLGLRAGHWRDWLLLPLAAAAVIATIFGLTSWRRQSGRALFKKSLRIVK